MSHADTIRSTDDEWRTQPTDLGGWANRAAQMKQTADALLAENQRYEKALKEARLQSLHNIRSAAFSPDIGSRYTEKLRLAIANECRKLEDGIGEALAGDAE